MGDLSRVRVSGPLEPFASGFAGELARQGFTANSAGLQLGVVAHLSRWLTAEGLAVNALDDVIVERFCRARRDAGYTAFLTPRTLVHLLAYLRGLGVIAPAAAPVADGPVDVLLEQFGVHLAVERGLVEDAVAGYLHVIGPFVEHVWGPGGIGLERLDGPAVIAFVVDRVTVLSPKAASLTVTVMRSLLRYLHLEGRIEAPLADVVPSVFSPRLAGLPKRLEPDQVKRLLDSCDTVSVNGVRDLAILTLLARLGLRACEVAGLCLEDIDWRRGEIVARGKGRAQRLPLPADVGGAIVAYLHDGRPPTAQGRAVFVRLKAPHRALTSARVSGIVADAAKRAGLGTVHAHRLRHTTASEVLRAGGSLPEVGQLLGHRRAGTTAIYAKVDRERLREIARPWPGSTR
jgi:site-specific recombinase XerD